MGKKYLVKNFDNQTYYCGEPYGWMEQSYLAEYFDTVEDAEMFISREERGKFQIETVYLV